MSRTHTDFEVAICDLKAKITHFSVVLADLEVAICDLKIELCIPRVILEVAIVTSNKSR